MSDYNDIARAIYASAAARPQRQLPRLHETAPVTKQHVKESNWASNVDHGALFLTAIIGGWIFYWHYRVEFDNIFRNWSGFTRAIKYIIGHLALDLTRFVLAILGIMAQIVLFASTFTGSVSRRGQLATSNAFGQVLRRSIISVSRSYDTIHHSQGLTQARQSLRYAHAFAAKYLPYPIAIAILAIACFQVPDFNRDPEIVPIAPVWVTKAQNRLRDQSSFDYTSAVVRWEPEAQGEESQRSVSETSCPWLINFERQIEGSDEVTKDTAFVSGSNSLSADHNAAYCHRFRQRGCCGTCG